MSEQKLRELGRHIEGSTPMHAFDDLVHRANRRVAVRRTGALAAVIAATTVAGFGIAQMTAGNEQTSPSPVDRSQQTTEVGCSTAQPDRFADTHGWITYSSPGRSGVWAVNPAAQHGSEEPVQVTEGNAEEPLEWSSDGTRLLIRRVVPDTSGPALADLVVLNCDGTETTMAHGEFYSVDGSFSPDGSQVIYSAYGADGIYTVDSAGGTPETLLPSASRRIAEQEGTWDTQLYNAVFSPDGKQIAYFDGNGDWGHSLRVMSSEGTDIRVVHDVIEGDHIHDLAWSPDGQQLMFADDGGIWIIGVDGSGLTEAFPGGSNPAWSPDGTRISYLQGDRLTIAEPDGTNVSTVDHGGSGPWNPLPLAEPDRPGQPATERP